MELTSRWTAPALRGGAWRGRWVALVLPLLLAAGSALAETPGGLPRYAGNYAYAGTRDQGVAIVEKAMEPALADLNMVMRMLAKKGIADRFAETILIEVPAGKVGMKVGTLDKVTGELDKPTTVKSEDGKQSGKVTFKFDGSKLTSILTGDDGTITTVFTLSADGKTLQRDVHVTSKRMKKPVAYRLIYKRKWRYIEKTTRSPLSVSMARAVPTSARDANTTPFHSVVCQPIGRRGSSLASNVDTLVRAPVASS
jgi:hypothetical protein